MKEFLFIRPVQSVCNSRTFLKECFLGLTSRPLTSYGVWDTEDINVKNYLVKHGEGVPLGRPPFSEATGHLFLVPEAEKPLTPHIPECLSVSCSQN